MTATAELRSAGFVDLACPRCGWKFFTTLGLAEHRQTCRYHEGLRQTGLRVTALNNARRVTCAECGLTSTPAAVGVHQRYKGHIGKVEQTSPLAPRNSSPASSRAVRGVAPTPTPARSTTTPHGTDSTS